MKRNFVLHIAKMMAEGDDPDNQRLGKLLLEVIPVDDKMVAKAVIEDIKAEVERGIAFENAELEGNSATSWTQEKALAWIAGTAFVDDRRPGWTKRDLAMFARGYATGRAVQKGNDNEILNVLMMSLDRILKHHAENK